MKKPVFIWLIAILLSMVFVGFGSASNPSKVVKKEKFPGIPARIKNLKNTPTALYGAPSSLSPLFVASGKAQRLNAVKLKRGSISDLNIRVAKISRAENKTIRLVKGKLGSVKDFSENFTVHSAVSAAKNTLTTQALQDARAAIGWMKNNAASLAIEDPEQEFFVRSYETDPLGMRHIRFQQYYQGIPVWADEIYVHVNKQDEIYAVNGVYSPTPSQIKSTQSAIQANDAIELATDYFKQIGKWKHVDERTAFILRIPQPNAEKVIWIDGLDQPHLVWFIDIYANLYDWYYVFIDAQNGEVLYTIDNRTDEGFVDASGTDLNDIKHSFRAYDDGSNYYLESDINEMSSAASDLPGNITGGTLVLDLQNKVSSDTSASFYYVTSSDKDTWIDKSSVSATYNMIVCYNYYKDTFGRRAIDGNASTMISVVNVADDGNIGLDNAFWNGKAMFYGNGDTYFKPLAGGLDVAAHEMSHGVIQHTAALIYEDQSGALNESFADVFGTMVDNDDWTIGEDIMKSGGIALRDMANPANPNILSQQPTTMNEYVHTTQDNGGVHTNSGITNRACYLVANAIGRDKTQQIYYRALSKYLTRQSQFLDCRNALVQAAEDLYGTGAEVDAINSAFDTVNIKEGSSGSNANDPSQNNVNPTTGGTQWIAFLLDNNQIGLYDVANGIDYSLPDVAVKTIDGNSSQITATADGSLLYYVRDDGYIGAVDVSAIPTTGNFNTYYFNDIYINEPGDLWNVAVSRDNTYLAFTSNYADDNNIYLLVGGDIYYIELVLPSTVNGVDVNTIKYADVLDWSPNAMQPKLAFDAYNEVELANGVTRSWWNMGEIDLTGPEPDIFELLPPQPDDIASGNVEYSSTNPDVIAFNYISQSENYWDLGIEDFDNPENTTIITFPGRNVERPTYSPDDKTIIVDRFTDETLLALDMETLNYTELTLNNNARYCEWFVIGGDYDLGNAKPTTDIDDNVMVVNNYQLEQNYPNPFNPSTVIKYQLPANSNVELTVYDALGRKVKTLVSGTQPAGSHSVEWNAENLASGLYYYRLQANGHVESRKMLLLK